MKRPRPGSRETTAPRDFWRSVGGRFCRSRLAVASVILLGLLLVLAALAPFLANRAPLWIVADGTWDFPILRGLDGEDLAWLGGVASLGLFLIVRSVLGRRGSRSRRARWSWALLVVAGTGTAWLAAGSQAENLAVIDFESLASEPGKSAAWAPIPHGWREIDEVAGRLAAPGRFPGHPLGTDTHGRDVAARILYGVRASLLVAVVAVGLSTVIGVLLGGLAGYFRGITDAGISWLIQVFMCFPVLFTILALQAFLPPGLLWIILLLGLIRWTGVARLLRGEMLRLRSAEFVEAARVQGVGDLRIVFVHLLPNALGPLMVNATFGIAGAILLESTLSFLGFGAPPPMASWGELLRQGRDHLSEAPHLVVFPGILILLAVTACNLAGEALRDALDPRLRGSSE